ncbi:MAG TPA: site-2 protease family protein [Acidimicrobiales bacterium]
MHSRAHFRLLGVPVRVEPFFLIVAVLFGINLEPLWLVGIWVVLVFLSVLVHELGHVMAYRAFGQRSAVVLHGFGGFTIPTGGGRRVLSKGRSIVVSLSGSVAQICVLGIPAMMALESDWAQQRRFEWQWISHDFNWWPVLELLRFISIWWGVFNLLPIRPLDGGHVAEELVGFENACKLSLAGCAVAGFFAYREFGTLFPILFFAFLAYLNYRDLREGQINTAFEVEAPEAPGGSRGGRRSGRPARGAGAGGGGGKRRGRGRADLQLVTPPSGGTVPDLEPRLSTAEAETRAWNALRAGDGERAAAILSRAGDGANPFLRASVALVTGPVEMAEDLFDAAYRAEPGGPPNLVPATLLADHGRAAAVAARLVEGGPAGIEAAGSLQTHLHYAERFRAAAEVGELVFRAGPRSAAQTAFEVACSWARASEPAIALEWVGTAVDAGFRAPGVLDGEPDLASVRSLPGWAEVRARLSA